MIRFLLKFGGVSTLLFAVCIALIRAQPYDDSELRAFLTPPDGCPAPCFMGIRPGVTTMEEAIEILEAHEWVENVTQGFETVGWKWSGEQPSWIVSEYNGSIRLEENRVNSILITTKFSLGRFWLTYGYPDAGRLLILPDVDLLIGYRGFYVQQGFFVGIGGTCPVRNYWLDTVQLTFQSDLLSYLSATASNAIDHPSAMFRCLHWMIR